MDTNTLNVERGHFARVCAEIDLTVPVVGKVCVNGHLTRNCTMPPNEQAGTVTTVIGQYVSPVGATVGQGVSLNDEEVRVSQLLPQNLGTVNVDGVNAVTKENSVRGYWLTVT